MEGYTPCPFRRKPAANGRVILQSPPLQTALEVKEKKDSRTTLISDTVGCAVIARREELLFVGVKLVNQSTSKLHRPSHSYSSFSKNGRYLRTRLEFMIISFYHHHHSIHLRPAMGCGLWSIYYDPSYIIYHNDNHWNSIET